MSRFAFLFLVFLTVFDKCFAEFKCPAEDLLPDCKCDDVKEFIYCRKEEGEMEPLDVVLKKLSESDCSRDINSFAYVPPKTNLTIKETVSGPDAFGTLKIKEVY